MSLRIVLVDRSGEVSTRYTPLAIMSLKAALEADTALRTEVSAGLLSYRSDSTLVDMLCQIVAEQPDVVGFSCQGWNYNQFSALLPPLRQLCPRAAVVFGGNHVTNRGRILLQRHPEIDFVVNGEGEETFCDLVRFFVHRSKSLDGVSGITYRTESGIQTTEPRPRVRSLADIPSAYLNENIDLNGYDIALLETNRGCPYRCSFCYWGAAIGQKLANSGVDRVRAELNRIGQAGIPVVFLCDANFGILERDKEIAEMIVATFARHGAPETVQVNWAKNHASRVGEILRILRAGRVRTNVFLALQTMSIEALRLANRDELGRKEMAELASALVQEDQDVGCELIFGLPGETLEGFKQSYDAVYQTFPKILLHPLWILPNTAYEEQRGALGLISFRADPDSDYEGVLQHKTLPAADNRSGLALLLAEEILIASGLAPSVFRILTGLGVVRPSEALASFERFLDACPLALARSLSGAFRRIRQLTYFARSLRSQVRFSVYSAPRECVALLQAFLDFLDVPGAMSGLCLEAVRYDCALLPRSDLAGDVIVESEHHFGLDVHQLLRSLVRQDQATTSLVEAAFRTTMVMRHRSGFSGFRDEAIDIASRWAGTIVSIERREPNLEFVSAALEYLQAGHEMIAK